LSQIQLLGEPSGGIARQEPIADGTVETAPEHAMNAAHGARLQGLLLGQEQVPDLLQPVLHIIRERDIRIEGDAGSRTGCLQYLGQHQLCPLFGTSGDRTMFAEMIDIVAKRGSKVLRK